MNCHYGRIVALVEPVVAIGLLLILVDDSGRYTRRNPVIQVTWL